MELALVMMLDDDVGGGGGTDDDVGGGGKADVDGATWMGRGGRMTSVWERGSASAEDVISIEDPAEIT